MGIMGAKFPIFNLYRTCAIEALTANQLAKTCSNSTVQTFIFNMFTDFEHVFAAKVQI